MKNAISVFLASFIFITPLLVGGASADTISVTKSEKAMWWHKQARTAPFSSDIAATKTKAKKYPFVYNGPRDPIFINGIN